jgi:putative peptide zinc metalloprotease protein
MQTLLSEHWHAVRFLRPRLREGVTPLHRQLRGKPWVLLLDPVTQRFHRMTPAVWQVLQLFDGRRTLDDVWATACAPVAGADEAAAAISQHELVQLMSNLHGNDLLQSQVSPDAGEVFERYRRQRRAVLKQSLLNPMSLRLPLLFPDAWFERQRGLARALFSLPVLLLWLVLVLPAAGLAWQHWQGLTENLSDRVLSASNLVLLWFTYPVVKAVHEWSHGLAVKAWGGTVREIGLMFIIFTPVPYVDASASYRFPSKWARATVAAAGIMAELSLGAVAMYVWLMAEPGLLTALAYNVVLVAGVSTLLVNGNPLMRYDGYFIASDLLELPNLAQRATQYWAYLVDRYAFGAHDAQPPSESQGERWILAAYGAVAPVYRLFITISLIWFVAGEYLFVGVLMALASAWSALVLPLWRGYKHLVDSPALGRRREVAMRRTLIALGTALAVVGLLPLPFYSVHQAVVWLPDEAIVRSAEAGHVVAVQQAPGTPVQPGTPLLVLDNLPLRNELGVAAAAVVQAQAQLRRAEVVEPVKAQPLRAELAAREARLATAQRRTEALAVHALGAGQWMPSAPTALVGRYVKRGEVLGTVVAGPSQRVRVAITQDDMDLIVQRLKGVQVRLVNSPQDALAAQVLRQVPGGEFDLVSPALGTSGGGEIAVDPQQQNGTKALRRVFDMELGLAQASPAAVFGDRAWVRFDLGLAPLGWQWFLRLRQAFLSRLSV